MVVSAALIARVEQTAPQTELRSVHLPSGSTSCTTALVSNKGSHRDMAIHPDDLERMNFNTVRRGFDPAEVRSYLVSVAAGIRRDSRETDASVQPSTNAARNDAKAILLAAQETAESIRAQARRQAELIRQEATREAEEQAAAMAAAPGASALLGNALPAPQSSAIDTSDAERRLQNKVRQLEALRGEVERLHVESGKAVRIASDERRAAERVRAESIDEIARLRQELTALQTQAGTAGVANSGMRVQIPGSVENDAPHIDTAVMSVVDSSAPPPPTPLFQAVKSAVGRAIQH